MYTNMRTLAAIVNSDIVTIRCHFAETEYNRTPKTYTYKSPKHIAEKLEEGDEVLVEYFNRSKEEVCTKVVVFESVDETPDLDPDSSTEYRFAFAKVDNTLLKRLINQEKSIADELKLARQKAVRSQALQALGLSASDITIPKLEVN